MASMVSGELNPKVLNTKCECTFILRMLPFCGFYPTQNLVSIVDELVLWCSGIGLALLYTIYCCPEWTSSTQHQQGFFFFFFLIFNFPMKTYMVKRAFMCFLFLFCVYFHFDIFFYLKKEANTSGRTEIFYFVSSFLLI